MLKPFVVQAALDAGLDVTGVDALLETSDNPGLVALATRVGAERVAATLTQQGLMPPAGASPIDLALGQVPTSARQLALAYARLPAQAHSRAVLSLLTGVVHGSRGTGKAAAVPGTRVAGKTGTARLGTTDTDPLLASFVGVVPAADPRWVVAVQVEGQAPQFWGGTVAAPAFSRIAAALP